MLTQIREKMQIMTFRLKRKTVKDLHKESLQRKISINAVANQIFEEYTHVYLPASKADFVYIPKKLLRELISVAPDEKIPAIAANTAYRGLEDVTCMMQNKFNSESVIQTLLTLAGHSGYSCTDVEEDGRRTISFNHDMGAKCSKLLQSCLEHSFKNVGLCDSSFDISDSRVTVTIEHEKRQARPTSFSNERIPEVA